MIEVELFRVAVLVTNKKVAFFITQKLRPLAVCQTRTEVILKRRLLLKNTIRGFPKKFRRKDEDWSSCEYVSWIVPSVPSM